MLSQQTWDWPTQGGGDINLCACVNAATLYVPIVLQKRECAGQWCQYWCHRSVGRVNTNSHTHLSLPELIDYDSLVC